MNKLLAVLVVGLSLVSCSPQVENGSPATGTAKTTHLLTIADLPSDKNITAQVDGILIKTSFATQPSTEAQSALIKQVVPLGEAAAKPLLETLGVGKGEAYEIGILEIMPLVYKKPFAEIYLDLLDKKLAAPRVYVRILLSLAPTKDQRAIPKLRQILDTEKDPDIRYSAIAALRQINRETTSSDDFGNFDVRDLKCEGGRCSVVIVFIPKINAESGMIGSLFPSTIKPITKKLGWKGKIIAGEPVSLPIEFTMEGDSNISFRASAPLDRYLVAERQAQVKLLAGKVPNFTIEQK